MTPTHRIYSPGYLYHDGIGIWVDAPDTEMENTMPIDPTQPHDLDDRFTPEQTAEVIELRKMTTGFYKPTESFRSIPEHVAVMFEDDCTLVAVVGASDDDPSNLVETHRYAEFFATAPETIADLRTELSDTTMFCEAQAERIEAQAETIARMRGLLITYLRYEDDYALSGSDMRKFLNNNWLPSVRAELDRTS